jgi:hypothetical protein
MTSWIAISLYTDFFIFMQGCGKVSYKFGMFEQLGLEANPQQTKYMLMCCLQNVEYTNTTKIANKLSEIFAK